MWVSHIRPVPDPFNKVSIGTDIKSVYQIDASQGATESLQDTAFILHGLSNLGDNISNNITHNQILNDELNVF